MWNLGRRKRSASIDTQKDPQNSVDCHHHGKSTASSRYASKHTIQIAYNTKLLVLPLMCEFIEHIETPLNACSVETLSHPIPVLVDDNEDDKDDDADARKEGLVWPLMLGCYELDEETKHRRGYLDLYAVPVPTNNQQEEEEEEEEEEEVKGEMKNQKDTIQTFGNKPTNVLGGENSRKASGILDGKWYERNKTKNVNGDIFATEYYYATAHASGEIMVHRIMPRTTATTTKQGETNDANFTITFAGKSDPPPSDDDAALCLALSWERNSGTTNSTRIISSYSNGCVAIHNVIFQDAAAAYDDNSSDGKKGTVQFIEEYCWKGHKMFHSPAEVWCACFAATTADTTDTISAEHHGSKNVVMSGGDEGQLKIWDLRVTTSTSVHTLKHFDAGVTVLSPSSTHQNEYIVACGSYDEAISILDTRYISSIKPKPLIHSAPLGGGIWRIKWHPLNSNRLLIGAMHGGCRVVDLYGINDDIANQGDDNDTAKQLKVIQSFTIHKSMAYGADWLVHQYPKMTRTTTIQAAASCSFYDRALYCWDVMD